MTKRVLTVGHCSADHSAIRQMLEHHFDVQVARAHTHDEALETLHNQEFDLVLVNRVFDADNSDGLELIKMMRADPQLSRIPMMLITNYHDYQQTALAAGAAEGFGKAELNSPSTIEKLAPYLGDHEQAAQGAERAAQRPVDRQSD